MKSFQELVRFHCGTITAYQRAEALTNLRLEFSHLRIVVNPVVGQVDVLVFPEIGLVRIFHVLYAQSLDKISKRAVHLVFVATTRTSKPLPQVLSLPHLNVTGAIEIKADRCVVIRAQDVPEELYSFLIIR